MPLPDEAKGQGQSTPPPSSPICRASCSCGLKGSVQKGSLAVCKITPVGAQASPVITKGCGLSDDSSVPLRGHCPCSCGETAQRTGHRLRWKRESRTRGSLPAQENKTAENYKLLVRGRNGRKEGFERREDTCLLSLWKLPVQGVCACARLQPEDGRPGDSLEAFSRPGTRALIPHPKPQLPLLCYRMGSDEGDLQSYIAHILGDSGSHESQVPTKPLPSCGVLDGKLTPHPSVGVTLPLPEGI